MYQKDGSNILEVEMSHTQATDLAVELFRLDEPLPADQQPAAVYLYGRILLLPNYAFLPQERYAVVVHSGFCAGYFYHGYYS